MRGLVVSLLAACVLAELDLPHLHTNEDYNNAAGEDTIETSYHSTYNYNAVRTISAGLGNAPLFTKNVYVHVAPEELQVDRQQKIIAPSQPRQRYRIIFIKAPSHPSPAGAHIQLPRQDEEKTLIYVLTKKQDEQNINIQEAVPTVPSKPEIYFVRYKTQKSSSYGPEHRSSSGQGVLSSYGPPSH